jgi:hypothetical protein
LSKEAYQEWLENLKEGDLVYYRGVSRYNNGRIVKIKGFTPSRMIKLSDGTTINKDGSIRGDKYFYIHKPTDKHRYEIQRRILLSRVREIDFGRIHNDQLKEILEICK